MTGRLLAYVLHDPDGREVGAWHVEKRHAFAAALAVSHGGGPVTLWWVDDTGRPRVMLGTAEGGRFRPSEHFD
jgi:hypothetical protein